MREKPNRAHCRGLGHAHCRDAPHWKKSEPGLKTRSLVGSRYKFINLAVYELHKRQAAGCAWRWSGRCCGWAPGSARVMGAFTGAPGVLREGGPALTQYGGGELRAHLQPAGYFCTPWLRCLQSGPFVAIFRQPQDRRPHGTSFEKTASALSTIQRQYIVAAFA